ncbi:uncharacterized protein LOC118200893 isoform X2 [Stegodyphus dumicola]|uniref:uncharacterized protein LOC118200893 isoform X2 n=1 Tax=Stegodyphus dumicola TaxID=202533 RepID=UPI0015B1AB37|nr:uncharacterized protein LOC118200893 isoform X2 [Stegodyphus dumicola]
MFSKNDIDKQGRPVSGRDTKWMVIVACIIIFFICLWLIILLLLWRMGVTFRWRTKQLDSPEAEIGEITDQPPPNVYESDEEPIYEEIREEDMYEEPRRPSEKPMYVELIPEENYYEEIDEEDYEIPLPAKNKKSSSGHYESPIYDEPNNDYEEVNNKTSVHDSETDVSARKSKEIFANTMTYSKKNMIYQKSGMGSQPSMDPIKSQYRSDSEVLIDIIERASRGEFDSSQPGSLPHDLGDKDIEKLICKMESQSEYGTAEKRAEEYVQETPIPSSNVHPKSIQRKVKSDAYVNQLTKHRMKQWSDDFIKSPSEVISSKYRRYSQGQNLPVNQQLNK